MNNGSCIKEKVWGRGGDLYKRGISDNAGRIYEIKGASDFPHKCSCRSEHASRTEESQDREFNSNLKSYPDEKQSSRDYSHYSQQACGECGEIDCRRMDSDEDQARQEKQTSFSSACSEECDNTRSARCDCTTTYNSGINSIPAETAGKVLCVGCKVQYTIECNEGDSKRFTRGAFKNSAQAAASTGEAYHGGQICGGQHPLSSEGEDYLQHGLSRGQGSDQSSHKDRCACHIYPTQRQVRNVCGLEGLRGVHAEGEGGRVDDLGADLYREGYRPEGSGVPVGVLSTPSDGSSDGFQPTNAVTDPGQGRGAPPQLSGRTGESAGDEHPLRQDTDSDTDDDSEQRHVGVEGREAMDDMSFTIDLESPKIDQIHTLFSCIPEPDFSKAPKSVQARFVHVIERLCELYIACPSSALLVRILLAVKVGLSPRLGPRSGPKAIRYLNALKNQSVTSLTVTYKTSPSPPISKEHIVTKLVAKGALSKAFGRLSSTDQVPQVTDEVIRELEQLQCPPEAPYTAPKCPRPLCVTEDMLDKTLLSMNATSAAGLSGWSVTLLRLLSHKFHFRRFLLLLLNTMMAGAVPEGLSTDLLLASSLFPLRKPNGKLRPITMGEIFYRLVARIAVT